jgi:hypothetical protein
LRHPATAAAAATAVLLAIAGCSSASNEAGADGADEAPTGGTWTVLHYSAADNDLEPALAVDVNEIGEVGSTGDLQVREFMDRSPEYGAEPVLDQGDWVGGRVFDITEDGTTELVEDLGDVDSSDPQVLADFVAQGMEDLPADHYALIISDHGGQWNGIGQDETAGGGLLTLPDLVDGISAGLDAADVEKLDLLGFDACLMAGYEVASAMAPLADRMVASQESEPGHGWDYAALETAAAGGTVDELGSAIIDGYQSHAEEAGAVDGVTLSLIDLTQMATLDTALAEFGSAVGEAEGAEPAVGRAQTEVQGFGKSPDPTQDQHLSDLGQLAEVVAEESPEVADPAGALTEAVDAVVLDSFAGEARAGSTGLSIYLPPSVDLYAEGYQDIETDAEWSEFLAAYYDTGSDLAADAIAAFTQAEPDVSYEDDGTVTLSATYDPAAQENLTEATISYGYYEPDGTVSYFGEEAADLGTAEDPTAVGTYDFTELQMSDGVDTVTAYVALGVDVETGIATIDVPMSYYAPEDVRFRDPQDVLLSLVIDTEVGEITSESYYAFDPETSTYGEAQLDPEGLISPEVANYDAQGNEVWYPTSDVGLYADLEAITYEFVPLPSGTELQMDLGLYDFGGNVSYSTTSVVVP